MNIFELLKENIKFIYTYILLWKRGWSATHLSPIPLISGMFSLCKNSFMYILTSPSIVRYSFTIGGSIFISYFNIDFISRIKGVNT
jgi:hypothetical protein